MTAPYDRYSLGFNVSGKTQEKVIDQATEIIADHLQIPASMVAELVETDEIQIHFEVLPTRTLDGRIIGWEASVRVEL